MGFRMIATGLLAGVGALAITLLFGYLYSVFIRSRTSARRLQLGVSTSILGPWLVGLYLILLAVLWKFIGRSS